MSFSGKPFGSNLANRAGTFSFPPSASHKGPIAVALELDESRATRAASGGERSWPRSAPLLHKSAGSLPASGSNESLRAPFPYSYPLSAAHLSLSGHCYSKRRVLNQRSVSAGSLAFPGDGLSDIRNLFWCV